MIISVVIVSYNSEDFIEETLDSVFEQTYPEIELIITDDHSSDKTCEICQKWLLEHQYRFCSTQLLTVEKNTGIVCNLNRGYAAAHGEWIKTLAADDLLFPTCLSKGFEYAQSSHDEMFITGIQEFGKRQNVLTADKVFEVGTASQQLNFILKKRLYVWAPSFFCKREFWARMKGFDEAYPMLEDAPFLVKSLQAGVRMGVLPDILVKYRVQQSSASRSGVYSQSFYKWRKEVWAPLLFQHRCYLAWWHVVLTLWREDSTRPRWMQSYFVYLLSILIDPQSIKWHILSRLKGPQW